MRVRKPIHRRLRDQDGGAKHRTLQRRQVVRRLLPDRLRRRSGSSVVPAGNLHHYHRHQSLPAELQPSERRRRVV
ncbi:hypothetical protein LINPERPRIM_LOCUS43137 [Linum perenne]